MPVGPGVDEVEHGVHRLRGREAEHFFQQGVDHRVQPLLYKGLVLVLGLQRTRRSGQEFLDG